MSSELADETMDSLLKEIDDEMENTINLKSQDSEQQEEGGRGKRRWSIPLQDIGDETMEMLVSHNTRRNVQVKDDVTQCQEAGQETAKEAPLPTRKSVIFSEGVDLHEYAKGSDDEHADSDRESVRIDTKWKKSSFVLSADPPNEANQSLVVEAHTDSEEGENHDLDLTAQDLLAHTVTDMDEKLTHMFDANRNTHRLKLMTEELDDMSAKKEEAAKIEYTLQATKPLTVGTSGNLEEASLIHFQTIEQAARSTDDESNEDDSVSEYSNEIRHSPSKIPLTNTISINNFSTNQERNDPQTRLSSGSSCCDSVTGLKTTIQYDRYNLLDARPDLSSQADERYLTEIESFSNSEIAIHHPNTSRIFSVATSGGDGYKSAKETAHSIYSTSSDEKVEVPPNSNSPEASIEDLDISAGLSKDDDTTYGIDEEEPAAGDNTESIRNENLTDHPSDGEQTAPQIPQLPAFSLPAKTRPKSSSKISSSIDETSIVPELSETPEVEPDDFHLQQPSSALARESSSHSLPEFCAMDAELQDQDSDGSHAAEEELVEPSNGHLESIEKNATDEISGLTDKQSDGTKNREDVQAPMLPSVSRVGSLFQENPFVDDFDTSGESMDLTRSVKPSNYLSIWHMQEEEIKTTSPALSSNSQFSRYTNSTDSSAANSNLEQTFKFKPRVISRSKYYYPEPRHEKTNYDDDYVLARPEMALDPLRRNTYISKKIQENIRNQRTLFSGSHDTTDASTSGANSVVQEKLHDEDVQALDEGTIDELSVVSEVLSYKGPNHARLELSTSIPDIKLGEEFAAYLETATHDNRSIHPSNEERVNYNVWGQDTDLVRVGSTPQGKSSISIDVIHRLLGQESKSPEPSNQDQQSPDQDNVLGILKTPVKEVSVGRGLSLKGYEAMISEGFDSEGNSRYLDKPKDEDLSNHLFADSSPVKKTHVGSPFKVKTKFTPADETSDEKLGSDDTLTQLKKSDSTADVDLSTKRYSQLEDGSLDIAVENVPDERDQKESIKLPDRGNIYLRLKSINDILLHNVKHHNAEFAVEFDNGTNTVQTQWQNLMSTNLCEINREFEIVLADQKEASKLIITLKCRYESPKVGLEEVIEKVSLGKKFRFGKSKYEYQRRYIQKPPKQDDWDFLFARDGSFGRCEIPLDDAFLKEIKFRNTPLSFTMINEWSRMTDQNSTKKLHELPRKPPYAIGTLHVEACYLERTSPLEKFPKTLEIAQNIISKFNLQQSIYKEGHMLQEGGDVQSTIQRRFFKLQGNNMIGYHDITMQPKLTINLLKVVRVFGPGDIPRQGERNLTDLVLLSGCFHLVFDNDEKITFSTESAQDGEDWCRKINHVVSLNKCHQPWVKYSHQSIDLGH